MSKYYYHPVTGEKVVVKRPMDCIFILGSEYCHLRDILIPEDTYGFYCESLCNQEHKFEKDCPLKDIERAEEVK